MKICRRKLSPTDVKYKIICAGAGLHIGFNQPVTVKFEGNTYSGKMHSKTKGRIDGLTKLFADGQFSEGDEIEITYDDTNNIITIDRETSGNKEHTIVTEVKKEPQKSHVQKGNPSNKEDLHIQEDMYGGEPEAEYAVSFGGEYYNMAIPRKKNIIFQRTIAKYGDRYYFLYVDSVLSCTKEDDRLTTVIKRGLGSGYTVYDQIFVNKYGIFVFSGERDRGKICRLYSHNGELKGTFSLSFSGRRYPCNQIGQYAYIVDDRFYCVSPSTYYVYCFETGEEYVSSLSLPAELKVLGVVIGKGKVCIKCSREVTPNDYQISWYRVYTDSSLLKATGKTSLILECPDNMEADFLLPEEEVLWLVTKKKIPNPPTGPTVLNYETLSYYQSADTIKVREFSEYSLKTGKPTGKVFRLIDDYETDYVAYLDGNIMCAMHEATNVIIYDLHTMKSRKLHGTFEANRLLIQDGELCVLKDYGNMIHDIISVPLDVENYSEKKICTRIW